MSANQDWAALLGRILLAAIFIKSGVEKITGFAGTAGYIASLGLPLPEIAAAVAIAVEVGAGLMLLFGYKARLAAIVIALFTVVATLMFHRYWTLPADKQLADNLNFWKNVSIVGGLLMVYALGPGRMSIDKG